MKGRMRRTDLRRMAEGRGRPETCEVIQRAVTPGDRNEVVRIPSS